VRRSTGISVLGLTSVKGVATMLVAEVTLSARLGIDTDLGSSMPCREDEK
jgi:hypothetical protein